MCEVRAPQGNSALFPYANAATTPAAPAPIPPGASPAGSRRRRLWELDGHAYCPVVGVCLPLPQLRRLSEKVLGRLNQHSDYEVHCMAVTESRHRSTLSEALQKELERRYALVVRAAQSLKSPEALGRWWDECRDSADWTGALWAALTHPRCDALLENRILGEVHMLQHQVGMAGRVDQARLEALQEENAILARELAGAQTRSQQQAQHYGGRLDAQQAAVLRLRAELIQTQTRLQQQQEELETLRASHPELPARLDLAGRNRALENTLQDLQRELQQARRETQAQRERADSLQSRLTEAPRSPVIPLIPAAPPQLEGRAVLCVGGRTASVPVYRELIEHRGARFLHHDGGTEDNSNLLDTTLAAADLVICQSGCISHNAYWRVKDHCKRTGKRCVFLDTPSRSALERALSEIGGALPTE